MTPWRELIRVVPDYPVPGVQFRDLTPLWRNSAAFETVLQELAAPFKNDPPEVIVGVEARGFIFAAPLAVMLQAGFVPARKPGKLPAESVHVDYRLEYGEAALEMHRDALRPGERVLIVDDVLATGGTSRAAVQLVTELGAHVMGLAYVVELAALAGRNTLSDYPVVSLLKV